MVKGKKRRLSAYQTAIKVLSLRDHGKEELRRKLAGKGYDKDEVAECIERLIELRYIDDSRVARQAVESMFRRRKGLQAARRWLINHGFSRQLIEEVCNDEEFGDEEIRVCKEARERLSGERAQVWLRLKRRGFRQRTIAKVLIVDAY